MLFSSSPHPRRNVNLSTAGSSRISSAVHTAHTARHDRSIALLKSTSASRIQRECVSFLLRQQVRQAIRRRFDDTGPNGNQTQRLELIAAFFEVGIDLKRLEDFCDSFGRRLSSNDDGFICNDSNNKHLGFHSDFSPDINDNDSRNKFLNIIISHVVTALGHPQADIILLLSFITRSISLNTSQSVLNLIMVSLTFFVSQSAYKSQIQLLLHRIFQLGCPSAAEEFTSIVIPKVVLSSEVIPTNLPLDRILSLLLLQKSDETYIILSNIVKIVQPISSLSQQSLDAYLILITRCLITLSPIRADLAGDLDDAVLETEQEPQSITHAAIVAVEHIHALIAATTRINTLRPQFCAFALSLPSALIDRSVLAYSPHGIVRELFRGWIRSSPVGRLSQSESQNIFSSFASDDWTVYLFCAQLVSTILTSLGDDEFFSFNPAGPLGLSRDDLTSFTESVRNVVFSLYWYDSRGGANSTFLNASNITILEGRRLLTRLLIQLYDRDTRRSWVPQNFWLMTSDLDVDLFIKAVCVDEQKLEEQASSGLTKFSKRGPSAQQVALLSPRLGILNNLPMVIPFDVRVLIFRQLVNNDKLTLQSSSSYDSHIFFPHSSATSRRIRRSHLTQDAYDGLSSLGSQLKKPLRIEFVDEYGLLESGIDGGGLFKELLTHVTSEAFSTDRGMWLSSETGSLYPSPGSYAVEQEQLLWYKFLGEILGKSMYEGIILDLSFAPFFLTKFTGRHACLDDLAALDPVLYKGLIYLKTAQDVESLCLTMSITDTDLGKTKIVPLIPNGQDIAVTESNRIQYIHLVCNYRLNTQIKFQTRAFLNGLYNVIEPRWLRMFSSGELAVLTGGSESRIDIDDLKRNTVLGNYKENDETIVAFWNVVSNLNQVELRQLLKFVTSAPRAPLLGFKELQPQFAIQNPLSDTSHLPTSSTCVNQLKLPDYKDQNLLRTKLLQSINAGAGFDLQ